MGNNWSRRKLLKTFGLTAGSLATFSVSAWAKNESGEPIILPDERYTVNLAKPVTAITCGAGARGNVYGNYAIQYPEHLKIIGVAEPVPLRNERYAAKHGIENANRFTTWEHVFQRPKFADAIIITTPDDLHYGPCMEALKMGMTCC